MRLMAAGVLAGVLAIAVRAEPGAIAPAGQGGARGQGPAAGGIAPDPAEVARGRQFFSATCSACHGAEGRGGADPGTDLSRSAIATAVDRGSQLGAYLRAARPDSKMPTYALADEQLADLSAFFRSLAPPPGRAGGAGRGYVVKIVGDPKTGEAYFNSRGCTTCHSVTGDLKGIASRRDPATIQGRLVIPRGSGGYPRGFNAPPPADEVPRTVTITQPSGETLSGTLWWITDFYVTFVDATGVRRTVARHGDEPKVQVTDPLAWHIEHMKTLTDADMHNLTAYLLTLR